MRHLGHMKRLGHLEYISDTCDITNYKCYIFVKIKMLGPIYFLVKCSILKVPTVHNVGDSDGCDAGPSLMHNWINTWHKKKCNNFKMLLFHVIYSKTFRLI